MSFLTWAALAIGALVLAPVVAHLLRRRPPDEQPFAAVRLVPDSPAVAHRRAAIEDRALLAVRALAVVLLALLGATPFVQCSRLSLARPSGASVALAIVIDDSLSMRAPFGDDEQTRFARAHAAARELLSSMQAGDAVAVVLAGKPARVALAATTNIDAARGVIERVKQTDRGTDLDGAVKIAGETLRELEHVDKRVVVLSDLADGHADGPPLAAPQGTKLWVPLDDMPAARPDCAAVRADQTGTRVTVTVACSPAARDAEGGERRVEVRAGDRVIGEAGMHFEGDGGEVVVNLTEAPPEGVQIHAVLTGDDVIAENDGAPVVSRGGELTVGMVSNEPEVRAATGGPPPVEQAFDALDLGVLLRPLATVPDHPEELRAFGLLIIDDVSGFTPAQRRELADWVEDGGVLLLTLGPNAAAAPLGSAFTPMLPAVVRWQKPAPEGIDPSSDRMFGETASGMSALAPKGRAQLAIERPDELRRLASWKDGEPFLLEHRMGRGVAYSLTLPFATTESDLVLRPGFLAFLVRLTETARSLGGVARTPVGTSWQLDGFRDVEVAFVGDNDELSPLDLERGLEGRGRRTVPELAGLYQLKLDGNTAYRVASVDETEVDLRPRPVEEASGDTEMGGVSASVDVSAYVAVLLLALLLGELLLRLRAPRRPRDAAPASGAEAIG